MQRRGFFKSTDADGGRPARQPGQGGDLLPDYCRPMSHKSLKQSSHDTTGGNSDRWPIAPGATQEIFNQQGPARSLTSGSPSPRRARFT